jgi:signal peptidase I
MITRGPLVLVGLLGVAALLAPACDRGHVNIAGHAMEPALKDGERAPIVRDVTDLERGDIVGFLYPQDESKSFVKRIVGLPGDRLEMREGRVVLNGVPFDEPYVADENRSKDSWGPIVVEPGKYFMMGDNRRNSSDSRTWGSVRRDAIWAKVVSR